jgi:hypothetical protein
MPDTGLVVAVVSVVQAAAQTCAARADGQAGAPASTCDAESMPNYGGGGNIGGGGFVPLTMESYVRLGLPAVSFLSALKEAATSPCCRRLQGPTLGTVMRSALHELGVALVGGDDVAYREMMLQRNDACLRHSGCYGGSCRGLCAHL